MHLGCTPHSSPVLCCYPHLLQSPAEKGEKMASGIAVDDEVIKLSQDMKVHRATESEMDRLKILVVRLSPNNKSFIVDTKNTLRVKDIQNEKDVFKKTMSALPKEECCFALYDCCYETKESRKKVLIFIMWIPDNAPLKSKMIYASSNNAVKQKLSGIKFEWQINDISDIKDPTVLIEKLGGTRVICLEGKSV